MQEQSRVYSQVCVCVCTWAQVIGICTQITPCYAHAYKECTAHVFLQGLLIFCGFTVYVGEKEQERVWWDSCVCVWRGRPQAKRDCFICVHVCVHVCIGSVRFLKAHSTADHKIPPCPFSSFPRSLFPSLHFSQLQLSASFFFLFSIFPFFSLVFFFSC